MAVSMAAIPQSFQQDFRLHRLGFRTAEFRALGFAVWDILRVPGLSRMFSVRRVEASAGTLR